MEILGDIEGIVCLVDDILVTGKTQEEHDLRLQRVLARLKNAGLTLGREKCEINKQSVKFLGQIVDESGVKSESPSNRANETTHHSQRTAEIPRHGNSTKQVFPSSRRQNETVERTTVFEKPVELGSRPAESI